MTYGCFYCPEGHYLQAGNAAITTQLRDIGNHPGSPASEAETTFADLTFNL